MTLKALTNTEGHPAWLFCCFLRRWTGGVVPGDIATEGRAQLAVSPEGARASSWPLTGDVGLHPWLTCCLPGLSWGK